MFFPNVVVWGDDYVKTFLDVTIPTLLADGNLPALKGIPGAALIIVCQVGIGYLTRHWSTARAVWVGALNWWSWIR